jgi:hypothetical protein
MDGDFLNDERWAAMRRIGESAGWLLDPQEVCKLLRKMGSMLRPHACCTNANERLLLTEVVLELHR